MRKNIKICIYVVIVILPIVLSACSNKDNNNDVPKSVKESNTTLVEDKSTDVTSSYVKTTTEEDITELISETKKETLSNTDNTTSQQQTQTDIQQITTVTSVNYTPAPVQTTPMPEITTLRTPRPTETEQTTTPVLVEYTPPTKPNPTKTPTLTVKGIGETYSYNGIEFTIDSVEYVFHSVDDYDGCCGIHLKNINISLTEPISPYCIYNIYSSDGVCIKTGTIHFCYFDEISPTNPSDPLKLLTVSGSLYTSRMPIDDFTIEFLNYQ